MSRTEGRPHVAILGAGPIGIEAALYAATLDLPCTIYERGSVGENLRRWGHVKLFTPFSMNSTPLGRAILRESSTKSSRLTDSAILTGQVHLEEYLEPLAANSLLRERIQPGTTVLYLGRKGVLKEDSFKESRRSLQPFRLLLRDEKGQERIEEADVVLDCTGTYGNGRFCGEGGIPAIGELALRDKIISGIDDVVGTQSAQYADKTTLVVGSGYSAATSVVLLAELAKKHASTWIVWLARSPGSQPIKRILNDPLRERDLLAAKANSLATRGEGHVEYHPSAQVFAIESQGKEGYVVRAMVAGSEKHWTVDRIITNVGFEPNRSLYQELQVCENVETFATQPNSLPHSEANFFVLGMKSCGRSSNFFLRDGFDQVREVFAILTKKANLNLYREKKS